MRPTDAPSRRQTGVQDFDRQLGQEGESVQEGPAGSRRLPAPTPSCDGVCTPPHRLRCGRTRTPAAPVRALQARPRPCAEQCGTAPSAIGAFGGSRCGGARMRMRGGGRARASTFRTLGLAPPKCCSTCGRCSRGSRHAAQSGARACIMCITTTGVLVLVESVGCDGRHKCFPKLHKYIKTNLQLATANLGRQRRMEKVSM